ncbi:MAG: nucleoside-diphosphate kinase [Armatimonadetes bacterium CG_4_10_14_3_um_filter_66_18]|nr:nucleoside-diphosphate kinase [Armatimonadota bacterium]OIO92381.1 MAG: nucleoside-diphosphate kinase [Armatimonadetes bacterium CG2_30_66_41]PIU93383.1 MAG: nucleoside-diphosphate kinase [Armatimonadetes bacterium CG06_land_8_20_14_3_00_66_21]PIX40088.1 MAG: nucleoside-diphosphate kinase [Armatimonadetes bacterium CG_4_8_14_3_um_filter_66_20]PIY40073.1 MAG: nucleoside-diphosphate kinase [Armatimonadetes bacterium CG_4_10_14_3_um_filter_66_18]PIZ37578.1 MAG: nucleoside-diphosphate kinase [A
MPETTFVMLKPDAVQRRLVGEVLSRLEAKGLTLVGLKLMQLPQALVEEHYRDHKGKHFYEPLLRFVTSGPVVVMAVRGFNAIQRVRDLMGATSPAQALPGTIRGDFALSNQKNLIHGSDSPESAQRELGLFFAPGEILEYTRCEAEWLTGEGEA